MSSSFPNCWPWWPIFISAHPHHLDAVLAQHLTFTIVGRRVYSLRKREGLSHPQIKSEEQILRSESLFHRWKNWHPINSVTFPGSNISVIAVPEPKIPFCSGMVPSLYPSAQIHLRSSLRSCQIFTYELTSTRSRKRAKAEPRWLSLSTCAVPLHGTHSRSLDQKKKGKCLLATVIDSSIQQSKQL